MIGYSVNFYKISEFSILQADWKVLECGNDMTYFQTYSWYEMLIRFAPKDCWFYETTFARVTHEGTVVMIAPLWVIKHTFRIVNRKGVYFFGRGGYSDYLNIVYDNFDPFAWKALEEILISRFGNTFVFELVKENTSFYKYLSCNYKFVKHSITTCVKVDLPNSVEDYKKSLSKNARQNLRTALNRIQKAGLTSGWFFDNSEANISELVAMRQRRVDVKNDRLPAMSLRSRIKSLLRFTPPCYSPLVNDKKIKIFSASLDHKTCAFFSYGYVANNGGECYVMQAGLDDAFGRYSPGMLLAYFFICHMIQTNIAKCVDFTRGTESYKFAIGGKKHFIHSFKIKLQCQ